jgi:hypothetical protein
MVCPEKAAMNLPENVLNWWGESPREPKGRDGSSSGPFHLGGRFGETSLPEIFRVFRLFRG